MTGPIWFELPYPDVEIPEGDGPLVVVAPSTAHDPDGRLVRVALEALADEPVRVLATTNRPGVRLPEAPANAVVVEWLSYSQAMAAADLVICHGGHGTIARALGAGVPVISCPAAGDMAENGARVAWAGAGLMLPWRLTRAAAVRLACAERSSTRRFGAARRRSRAGLPRTTDPSEVLSWSRNWLADRMKGPAFAGQQAPGVGIEPTTSRLTVERGSQSAPPDHSTRPVARAGLCRDTRSGSASTSAWQFAQRSTHFAASSRSFVDGSA